MLPRAALRRLQSSLHEEARRASCPSARLKARVFHKLSPARWGNSHAELRRESLRSVRAYLETRFGHALDKHGALWREVSGYAQEYLRFHDCAFALTGGQMEFLRAHARAELAREPPREMRELWAKLLRMQGTPRPS